MAERRAEIICDELFFERSSDINSNDKTNLLRTVINGLPDIVSLQKPDHTVLFYNEAGYRFLGRRPDQVDGKKCFELIGRSAPCELCATREATISGKTETIEKYLPEYGVWMETRAIPVLNGEGAVEMIIEILRDTTDSRRMMRELQKSEERFRTLFEEANVAIVLHDKDTGRVIDANLTTLRRYGLSSVGELKTNDFCMEPPYSFNEALEWIHKADREGPQRFEWLNRRATGELFWEDVLLSKIVIGGKERILATTIDITERKKLEEQMLHSQKMEAVGTLAGGVAHDFNNLLMSILGYASMLLMKTEQTHPFYEKLKTIERQVESGAELTRQLLGFAQGGRYETKPIWINELLTKTSNVFGKTRKEIVVHTKLQGNLYAIEADEGQIEQVLMNLYMNASQAMPSGGDLYIETENVELLEYFCLPHGITPGAYIKISITDTGEGMDPETRRRIFEPFFTTREVGKGTGLGLASAYGIVRNHGGAINVYSEKGHGSKFTIYLPASIKAAAEEKVAQGSPTAGNETILIVDDEPANTDALKELLEIVGYRVMTANSGLDAIEVFKSHRSEIHMVILDVIMMGMSGWETFERLKTIDEDVRVLLSSGYGIEGEAAGLQDLGCAGFIQKPFRLDELSKKIRFVLDRTDNR